MIKVPLLYVSKVPLQYTLGTFIVTGKKKQKQKNPVTGHSHAMMEATTLSTS